ncbi:MAG: glycosyltransferase family 39 protein [Acidimicrobiales bacterium]
MRIGPAWIRRGAVAGVALAVIVGIVVRFTTTSPLWLDEALSVNIASLPLGDIPAALRHDGHPPLYYWMLHGWIAAFGDGDVAVRSLSGVIGVATLPLAWVAGRLLGGRRLAAVTLVVVSLSPYMVRYSTEARMYSLVMLLVLAGYIAIVKLRRGAPWGWLVVFGATAALLPWTHYWGLYLVITVGMLLVWSWWRQPDERAWAGPAIVTLGVSLLPFVLWLPVVLDQAAHTGTPWATPARPTRVLVETLETMGGGAFPEAETYGILIVLLGVLAACTSDAEGRLVIANGVVAPMRRIVFTVVAAMGVGTLAGLLGGAGYAGRYAAIVVPLILLIVASALTRQGAPLLLGGLGVLLVGLALVSIGHNVTDKRTHAGVMADLIAADVEPDDVVVVCPDQLGPSVARAMEQKGLDPPVPYPAAGDPRFVDWRDYAERNAAADPVAFADDILERAGDGRIWLVSFDGYRTFEGQCAAVAARIAQSRPLTELEAPEDAFEPAQLQRFG